MTTRSKNVRLERSRRPSLKNWSDSDDPSRQDLEKNSILPCAWGRLLFAHTFRSHQELARALRQEADGQRDIAIYLRDPHVVCALAPDELFLDPSHTYRLWLERYRPAVDVPKGLVVRRMESSKDIEGIRRIYATRRMVDADPDFLMEHRQSPVLTHLVAENARDGAILGTVTGVDHERAFSDPEKGSSLWCLAVDPQAPVPRVGELLVRTLVEHYVARGRAFVDLSVMHDNHQAIRLYEKLGFVRVPVFCLKTKNAINQALYTGAEIDAELTPYEEIIIQEARLRGIAVDVLDEEDGTFSLTLGGRSIVCRGSLSELTHAVAMGRCQDKRTCWRLLRRAGFRLPAQQAASTPEDNASFLAEHGRIVVKPATGEQGNGVAVDLSRIEEMEKAVKAAQRAGGSVILEEYVEGDDLRIVVIGDAVVAASIRRPPEIQGTGKHTVRELIEALSRRRSAATKGESRIPLDEETQRCVAAAGHGLDDTLSRGTSIRVRRTANLHTGGTLHDVTDQLSESLAEVAVGIARTIDIPVVGLDLIVPTVQGDEYQFIEANERPGLANHEPQPTAERFIDLLFPMSSPRSARPSVDPPGAGSDS